MLMLSNDRCLTSPGLVAVADPIAIAELIADGAGLTASHVLDSGMTLLLSVLCHSRRSLSHLASDLACPVYWILRSREPGATQLGSLSMSHSDVFLKLTRSSMTS